MPNPVVHFEATGKDGNKLRDFYSKVFGWNYNVMPEMDYGIVDNGGAGINGGVGGTGDAPAGSAVFYIAVEDLQATLDKIGSAGGATVMPVMEIPGIVTLAMFSDPEGNTVGLVNDDPNQEMPPSTAQPAANKVTWFEIVGKDSAKLRDFYTSVFGWPVNVMPDQDYAMVDNQGRGIGGGIGGGDQPHAIWYVEVEDPQAMMDKITATGGKVVSPVTNGGMVTFGYFSDPEGNKVGIYKMNQPG